MISNCGQAQVIGDVGTLYVYACHHLGAQLNPHSLVRRQ